MKRLFNKHNPISRVVALWLVFVMMAVPFFSNSGLLSNPKANGGSGTPVPTYDITESMVNTDFTVTAEGKVKYNPSSPLVAIYYYGVNTIKVNAADVVLKDGPSSSANIVPTLDIQDSNSEIYTITDVDIKIVTSTSDNFQSELATTSGDLETTADVPVTGYYAVYVKVTANKGGVDCSYENYVKEGSYYFESKEPFDGMNASLIDAATAGAPVSADKWYTDTYIQGATSNYIANLHKAVGDFKYGYSTNGGEINWVSVSGNFGEAYNVETVDFGEGLEGTYDIYLGYFSGDTFISKSNVIGTVNIDTKAPVINDATGLYYNPNGWNNANQNYTDQNVEKVDDDVIVREESEKSKYRYFVVVDESGSGVTNSNIKMYKGDDEYYSVTFTAVNGQTGVFYTDAFVTANGSTDIYTVKATDLMGNESSASDVLDVLELVDTSYVVYTFDWSIGPLVGGSTSGRYQTSNSWGYDGVIEDYLELRLSVESYNEVEKIYVTEGNATIDIWDNTTNSVPSPYYSATGIILTIPSDETKNGNYSNLKLHVKYKNINDEYVLDMKNVLIDQTEPIFKKADGTTDLVSSSSSLLSDDWNASEDVLKIDILSGTSQDAESDLVTARYEVGGHMHNFTITDGKVDDGAIDIANIPESTDANGTPITIYAKDAADNETTTTVYYKKDTIEPSPSVYFSNGTTTLYSGDIIINKDYTVYASVFEEGSGVQKVEYCLNDDNGTLVNTVDKAGMESCSLAELISKDGVDFPDGQYSVSVKATDYAGNFKYAPNLDFTLDTSAPTMPNGYWPILQESSDNGTTWTDITTGAVRESDQNGNWKDVYYLDSSKQYRYEVKVMDEGGLSVTPTDVISLSDSNLGSVSDTVTTDPNDASIGVYYVNINTGSGGVSTDIAKVVDFSLTDKAGNTNTAPNSPYATYWGLKLTDKDLLLSATLYDVTEAGEVGSPISLDDTLKLKLAAGTNKAHFLVLDVSSAYAINPTSIVLEYKDDSTGITIDETITGTAYNSEKNNDPAVKDDYGRYHYYMIYSIDSASNITYKDLTVSASDGVYNSGQGKTQTLLSILFDITKPIVYANNAKDTFTLPSAWAKNVSGSIYIIPGEDTVVESALAKAYFVVEGEDGVNNLGMDMAGTSAGGTVETPANFSSATTAGTKITVYAEDAAGNDVTWEQTVKVDAKAPTIDSVSVAGNPNILVSDAPLKAAPTITAKVTDNLTVDYIKMTVTYPDGTVKEKTFDYAEGVDAEVNGTAKEVSYTIPKLAATDANIPDGAYRVEVKAFDLAGNEATSITKSFRVDTTKPVVTAKISSGTVSAKDSYYYKSNVVVALTYNDVNTNMPSIVVTDNGTPVNVNWSTSPDANGNYTATYTASTEGVHAIKIIAKDAATNDAVPSEVEFKIDKTLPTLSTTVNGLVYTDNTGLLYMTNNVTLNASVNDTNEDRGDLNYQLILTKPDQETVTNLYQKTTDRSFTYTEEGEYTINLFAVDKANNQSSIRSIRFRIDKAAPNLSINGVGSGSSADSVTVSCVMQESFWQDAEGTITIYSRAGDGVPEVLLKTINVTPTSASTVISETFTETGVYRIEFTASDRAGHTSETSTQFTIDRESPVVTLDGPENYTKTKDEVPIAITVVDDFYLQKKVNLVATRTDDTGKVHDLDFGTWNEGGNPTNIAGTFAEDGIYDISITATDMAGNSDSKSVHFTIDKSAPIIGDLSYLDDQILTSFSWDEDLDELVSDLTVCDVQMYLNGSVYDGESEIEDGAYTLLIVAEDELGNKTEKEVTFVLDTKVPVFIVTGVEEDEVKNEEYSISVSLQLEEDTLTSVTLNGKEMYSGDNNVCSFTVSEKGEYKLVMSATDAAGNTASYEIEFKYGEDSMWWLWLIIAIAVLLVSGIVLIVIKKKNNDK